MEDYFKNLMTEIQKKAFDALHIYYAEREKFIQGYLGEKLYILLKELSDVLLKLRGFSPKEYKDRISPIQELLIQREELAMKFYSAWGQPYWEAVSEIMERFDALIREHHPEFLPTLILRAGEEETRINLL